MKGIFIFLALLLAQAPALEARETARIERLDIVNEGGQLKIVVMAAGAYKVVPYRVEAPPRLAFDFYNAVVRVRRRAFPVDHPMVKGLRLGQFKEDDEKIARLVLDLKGKWPDYQVQQGPEAVEIVVKQPGQEAQEQPVSITPIQPEPAGEPAPVPAAESPAAVQAEAGRAAEPSLAEAEQQVTTEPVQPEPASEPGSILAAAQPEPQTPAVVPSTGEAAKPELTTTPTSAPSEPAAPADALQPPAQPQPATPPQPIERAAAATVEPVLAAAVSTQQPEPRTEGTRAQDESAAERPKYTGEPINIDFKEGDLIDFFRLLSEISGLNIVLDPEIKGTISLKMVAVPYDQVFDIVLENHGLAKRIEGNVVRVARKETLRREEEEKRKLKEAQTLAADTLIKPIKLNYASAESLAKIMEKQLSPKGEIVVDQRTNTILVKDISTPLSEVERLVSTLDIPQPQVEIEARIVAATRDFARDIGMQFGFVAGNLERITVGGPNTFGTIGGVRPSASPTNQSFAAGNPFTGRGTPGGTSESGGVSTGIGSNNLGNFNLNVPAQSPNRFSGVGISVGNIFDTFLLDAAITAGEAKGLAKLISQPKVTTQNNSEATITQGIRFPVQVIQNNTVTVQFFDAALRLLVTPQITEQGTVLLNLKVENNVADFSEAGRVNGIPSIRTSESSTKVLVADGGTTVIGGILIDNESRTTQGVPGLMNLPVIGNLFKRSFIGRTTQEILFFITPRVRRPAF